MKTNLLATIALVLFSLTLTADIYSAGIVSRTSSTSSIGQTYSPSGGGSSVYSGEIRGTVSVDGIRFSNGLEGVDTHIPISYTKYELTTKKPTEYNVCILGKEACAKENLIEKHKQLCVTDDHNNPLCFVSH